MALGYRLVEQLASLPSHLEGSAFPCGGFLHQLEVLARKRRRELRRILPGHEGWPLPLQHRGTPSARLQDLEDAGPVEVESLRERKGLGGESRDADREKIVHKLRRVARPDRPHVLHPAAHAFEEGSRPREIRLLSPYEEEGLPSNHLINAPRHGRVDIVYSALRQTRGEVPTLFRVDRA